MIPSKSHPSWAALVKGELKPQFKVFAGNMMLSQCSRKLKLDTSPEALRACIDEAHSFFVKYSALYAEDLKRHFR